jgi:archaellum biogenesis ATPase FlaH
MDFIKIIAEVGFPIAAAMAAGYFVFLTLKFILAGVTSAVKSMAGIITALDKRVAAMNHDVIRIDTKVSHALGIPPDLDRIARAEQSDARRD